MALLEVTTLLEYLNLLQYNFLIFTEATKAVTKSLINTPVIIFVKYGHCHIH